MNKNRMLHRETDEKRQKQRPVLPLNHIRKDNNIVLYVLST